MEYLDSPSAWLALGVGLLVWLMGHGLLAVSAKARDRGERPRRAFTVSGHTVSLIGLAVAVLGIRAGLWGPSRIGPVTVQPFSFSASSTSARRAALSYVRSHTHISRRASVGWHGASDTSLQYTVANKGHQSISSIILRFRTGSRTGYRTLDMKLFGPFPAGKTRKVVLSVPSSVDRSYFDSVSTVSHDHIVGARF